MKKKCRDESKGEGGSSGRTSKGTYCRAFLLCQGMRSLRIFIRLKNCSKLQVQPGSRTSHREEVVRMEGGGGV